MLWHVGCLALCLVLSIPAVQGLLAVYSLQRRACLQPPSFILARALHRPLYATCLLLLSLRAAFFALIATTKLQEEGLLLKVATFWLLDLPSVAMTAMHGYIVLFAVQLVFRRRWPNATRPSVTSGMLTAVFVAFGASLVVLVTLVAICRAREDSRGLVVPQWMTLGYSAVIWTTLGLLMLKYEGNAVQILWRYRRRNRWSSSEGEEGIMSSCQRLPVLSISCLKNLAVCTTLLAELLVVRGIFCAVAASQSTQSTEDAMDAVDVDSWRSVILYYYCWEVACVAIVLHMLQQTPIAVYPLDDSRQESGGVLKQRYESPSAPALDDDEIQIQFQVPSVRELVTDYVVPSNTALLSAQRRGIGQESSTDHRYCRVHHTGKSPAGAEYVNCRCNRERGDGQFLSNANVPLLAEEYEPLDAERSTDTIEIIR